MSCKTEGVHRSTLELMRLFLRLLFGLVLATICFIAGALTAGARYWFQPLVTVTVVNESGQDLRSLRLVHSSLSSKGAIDAGALRSDESRIIRFFLGGEGSYTLEATLSDGRVLNGGEGYVEAGYSSKQVISETGIKGQIKIGL